MSEREERPRVQHRVGGEVRTKQSEAAHVDINKLMERYTRTGLMPQKGEEPRYGDFSSGMDFHQALSAVREAEKQYMRLPVQIRRYTENDPGKFLDLVMTAEGRKELEERAMAPEFAPPGAPEAVEETPEVQEPVPPSEPG